MDPDRQRLRQSATVPTRRSRVPAVVVAALIAAGAVAAALILWPEGRGVDTTAAATTTTTEATTTTVASTTTTEATTTTTTEATTTTTTTSLPDAPPGSGISPLPVESMYDDQGGTRRVWVPEGDHGWVVDLATGQAVRVDDLPGPTTGGVAVPDGRLLLEAGGSLWLGEPWEQIAPEFGDLRFLGSSVAADHIHLYLESNGELLNLWFEPGQPEVIRTQWTRASTAVSRVTASHSRGLAALERFEDGFPVYETLAEATGGPRNSPAVPEPGEAVAWGLEIWEDQALYLLCEEAADFSDCVVSTGLVVDLSAAAPRPIEELLPGFSVEWATPDGPPPFVHRYGGAVLLTRSHLMLADVTTGERVVLVRSDDR